MRKPLTALLLALTLTFVSVPMAGAAESGGSAFERVTQTGTIRCGYIIYRPQLSKDPNTGTLSGLQALPMT